MLAFSSLLAIDHPEFWSELRTILENNHEQFIQLERTREIWARDYMPVVTPKGDLVRFKYDPPYFKKTEQKYRTLPEEVEACLNDKEFIDCPLVVDGGNVVFADNAVIMTDAIFRWNPTISRDKIERMIKDAFGVDRLVVILPHPDDPFHHADGVLAYAGLGKLFVSDDSKYSVYSDRLRDQLSRAGFDCILIPGYDVWHEEKENSDSAKGNYVNFLETDKVVIVPKYNLPTDEQALEIIQSQFDKPCVQLDCNSIAKKGGVLHCVSWC